MAISQEVKAMRQQEVEEWKLHPITQQLFRLLKESRDSLMEQWANGTFHNESGPAMEIANGRAQGSAKTMAEILAISAEDLFSNE